jgi:large subunit ribosomal protein L15
MADTDDKSKDTEPSSGSAARRAPKPAAAAGAAASAAESAAAGGTGGRTSGLAAGGRAGLKLHHLRPAPGAHTPRARVGRGEASKGKTAGRGTKGSKARHNIPEYFEGGQMPLHRRLPKLKGFSNARFKTTYQVVNLDRLAALYPAGGEVNPESLVAKGAVRPGELVKVLGQGEVSVALQVSAHAFSAAARTKITAAGGAVTEL